MDFNYFDRKNHKIRKQMKRPVDMKPWKAVSLFFQFVHLTAFMPNNDLFRMLALFNTLNAQV